MKRLLHSILALAVIFMIQILPHTGLEYGSEFRVLTYQSIVD